MKNIVFLVLACFSLSVYAQTENTQKENVLIISAHPDDWEYGMSGTAYLLSKEYDIHVIIATKALASTGMIHDRQIYYYSVGTENLAHFEPEFYVNISDVKDEKKELLDMHILASHSEGLLEKMAFQANEFYGLLNRCKYAEGFRTHYPMVNHRWDKKALHWLLDLE